MRSTTSMDRELSNLRARLGLAEPCKSSVRCDIPGEFNEAYQKAQLLGRGGQAQVFLYFRKTAVDNLGYVTPTNDTDVLPALVAVKQTKAHNRLAQEDLVEEVGFLQDHINARGGHRCIARVFSVEPYEDDEYYPHVQSLMAYCNTGNLHELYHTQRSAFGKPIPEAFIWHVFKEVASALEFLHSGYPPIVHRDVKPANIMLHRDSPHDTSFPRVLLTDFDCGGVFDPIECSYNWGTREYQAPETKAIHYRSTPKSDVYCLGGVIQFLAGKPPPGRATCEAEKKWGTGLIIRLEQKRRKPINIVRRIAPLYSYDLEHWMRRALTERECERIDSRTLVSEMIPRANRWIDRLGADMTGLLVYGTKNVFGEVPASSVSESLRGNNVEESSTFDNLRGDDEESSAFDSLRGLSMVG